MHRSADHATIPQGTLRSTYQLTQAELNIAPRVPEIRRTQLNWTASTVLDADMKPHSNRCCLSYPSISLIIKIFCSREQRFLCRQTLPHFQRNGCQRVLLCVRQHRTLHIRLLADQCDEATSIYHMKYTCASTNSLHITLLIIWYTKARHNADTSAPICIVLIGNAHTTLALFHLEVNNVVVSVNPPTYAALPLQLQREGSLCTTDTPFARTSSVFPSLWALLYKQCPLGTNTTARISLDLIYYRNSPASKSLLLLPPQIPFSFVVGKLGRTAA